MHNIGLYVDGIGVASYGGRGPALSLAYYVARYCEELRALGADKRYRIVLAIPLDRWAIKPLTR